MVFLRFVLIIVIMYMPILSQAQTMHWANSFGNGLTDRVYGMTEDASGNVYCTGKFSGTVDFDFSNAGVFNLTSAGSSDAFVAKYTNAGAFLWAFKIGGTNLDESYRSVVNNAGELIVVGFFRQSNVDFDPGPGVYNLSSNGQGGTDVGFGGDAFVAKYTAGGNFVWAFNVGGSYLHDNFYDVDVDPNDNIYVSGDMNTTATMVDLDPGPGVYNIAGFGSGPACIVKYSTTGNFIWGINLGDYGISSSAASISVDPNDTCLVVTGHIKATNIDFDPGPGAAILSSNVQSDVWIAKYSYNGNYMWAQLIGGNTNTLFEDFGHDVHIDNQSNIYTTGSYSGSGVNFNPLGAAFNVNSNGLRDIYLAKYASSGQLVWHRNMGSTGQERFSQMSVNGDKITLGGSFSGTMDLDPGTTITNVTSNGGYDVFVSSFDTSGTFNCGYSFGGNADDLVHKITSVTNPNQYFLGGEYNSPSFDLDPGTTTQLANNGGLVDGYFGKFQFACFNDSIVSNYSYGFPDNCDSLLVQFSDLSQAYNSNITNWLWNFGDGGQSILQNPSHAYLIAGNYLVQLIVTNNLGKKDTFSQSITTIDNKPNVTGTASPSIICAGESTVLTGSGALNYVWSNNIINGSPTFPLSTSTYTVVGTNANGCKDTNTVSVTVIDNVPITIAPTNPLLCIGDTISLTASGAQSYIWSPNVAITNGNTSNPIIVQPTSTITYNVIGTDANGCTGSANKEVRVVSEPMLTISKTNDIECEKKTTQLTASGAVTYTWSPPTGLSDVNSPSPLVDIDKTTTYYVTANIGSCSVSDSITVYYFNNDRDGLFVPNAFTPNADGLNDCFRVRTKGNYAKYELYIYNRWGMPVFESDNPNDCWDATYGGEEVPVGVYYYYLNASSTCGPFKVKGDITVIR